MSLESRQDAASNYDWNDVFGLIRRQEARWGENLYGVSFGSPQLVLVYRKDLFQQWELSVPTTWEEYGRTIQIVSKRVVEDEHAAVRLNQILADRDKIGFGNGADCHDPHHVICFDTGDDTLILSVCVTCCNILVFEGADYQYTSRLSMDYTDLRNFLLEYFPDDHYLSDEYLSRN